MKPAQEVELQKPRTGEYDVVAWVVFTKSEYVINGYLEPLANFFVNPALADPSYNPDDLVPVWMETGGVVGGTNAYLPGPTQALYGLPYATGNMTAEEAMAQAAEAIRAEMDRAGYYGWSSMDM